MNITTYRGPYSNNMIMVTVDNGETCGSEAYREAQIVFKHGSLWFTLSDGYTRLKRFKKAETSLKELVTIIVDKL